MRKSGEAKYFHLNDDLHVLIEVFAPPAEAYARMGHALEEIKKFLIPVSINFFIRILVVLRILSLNLLYNVGQVWGSWEKSRVYRDSSLLACPYVEQDTDRDLWGMPVGSLCPWRLCAEHLESVCFSTQHRDLSPRHRIWGLQLVLSLLWLNAAQSQPRQ